MRCKFCFFEGVLVSPATQSRALRILRPILRVAVCRRCHTRHLLRGRLFLGPNIPVKELVVETEEVADPQQRAKAMPMQSSKRPWAPSTRTPTGRYRSRTI